MQTIWKYDARIGSFQLELPKNAQVLTVQMQYDQPRIWVLVDAKAKTETRFFEVFGTGHNIIENPKRVYIGTFQLAKGSLIFHLFEII